VNREFEVFVQTQIDSGRSFAIETTLRSEVTFEQARMAKAAGFVLEMRYLALGKFALHLERIKYGSMTMEKRVGHLCWYWRPKED